MSGEQAYTTNHSTVEGSAQDARHTPRLLDEEYYSLDPEEASFFKTYTGIEDDQELKKHIIRVQTDAYAVSTVASSSTIRVGPLTYHDCLFLQIFPYNCIRRFAFTKWVLLIVNELLASL